MPTKEELAAKTPIGDEDLKKLKQVWTGKQFAFGVILKEKAFQKLVVDKKVKEADLKQLKKLGGFDGRVFITGTCMGDYFIVEGPSKNEEDYLGKQKKVKAPSNPRLFKKFIKDETGKNADARFVMIPQGTLATVLKDQNELDKFVNATAVDDGEDEQSQPAPEATKPGVESKSIPQVDDKMVKAGTNAIWKQSLQPVVEGIGKMKKLFEAEGNQDCQVAAEACADLQKMISNLPEDPAATKQLIHKIENDPILQVLDEKMKIKGKLKTGLQQLEKLLVLAENSAN